MKIKNRTILKESDDNFAKLINMKKELTKAVFGEKINGVHDKDGSHYNLYEMDDSYVIRKESPIFGTAKLVGEWSKKTHTLTEVNSFLYEYQEQYSQSSMLLEQDGQNDEMVNSMMDSAFEEALKTLERDLRKASEGDKDKTLEIDPNVLTLNEQYLNEVLGAAIFGANLALNAPSIITLAGKLAKSLGKTIDANKLKAMGENIEDFGKEAQSKYMGVIKKILSKVSPNLDDKQLQKMSTVLFITLLASVTLSTGVVGGYGEAGQALGIGKDAVAVDRVKGAVQSAVKMDKDQLLDYTKKLVPAVLGKIFN